MRKMLTLFGLVLALAGAWPRLSLADCPGVSACVYSMGCPKGAILVRPDISIQAMIDAAPCTGATICVAPGTYTELINFHGKPIRLLSSGGPAVTFLDGGGTGPVVTFASGEGKNSVVEGFTIQNGRAAYGGGVSINGASPTIRNCILTRNAATGGSNSRGGGMWVGGVQASPAILCTQFQQNTADYAGGGLASGYSANPYLRSDLFEGNSASYGGAIGVYYGGRLDLGWTELIGNLASNDGGGIHAGVAYGNLMARQVWFKNNTAGGTGGGMWVPAGLAEVINTTFDGNRASSGGALSAGYGSMVDVASTLFVGNTSTSGGAVLVNTPGSNTSVVNHYNGFFGNTATYSSTYGNVGLLTLAANPLGGSCCPAAGSPPINAGIPDPHFVDPDGSRNDMGACGGPALSVFGIMQ